MIELKCYYDQDSYLPDVEVDKIMDIPIRWKEMAFFFAVDFCPPQSFHLSLLGFQHAIRIRGKNKWSHFLSTLRWQVYFNSLRCAFLASLRIKSSVQSMVVTRPGVLAVMSKLQQPLLSSGWNCIVLNNTFSVALLIYNEDDLSCLRIVYSVSNVLAEKLQRRAENRMTSNVPLARRNNFATRAGWRRLCKQGSMLSPRTQIYICSLFQFVDVESAITSIVDRFAHKLRRGYRKELFSLITCCLMFLAGLSMVTEVCNFNS